MECNNLGMHIARMRGEAREEGGRVSRVRIPRPAKEDGCRALSEIRRHIFSGWLLNVDVER